MTNMFMPPAQQAMQLPKAPTNPLGLAQLSEFDPPKEINVHGVKWSLYKDYRDSMRQLPPPNNVKWDDGGFIPMPQYDGKVYWYCMYGTKFPAAGSQERPVRVLYQWFHTIQIPQLSPNFITDVDWSRANVYTADYGQFAQEFFGQMFAVHSAVQTQKSNTHEWPAVIDVKEIIKPKPAQEEVKE